MTQKNVLIADQDINNLQYFFNYIHNYPHYNIMNATSAAMALKIKREQRLDLIVIDWLTVFNSELPLQGFWAGLTENGDIPLILMTHSIADFMNSNSELSDFVKDIIRKPFNAMALREIMDRIMNIPVNQHGDYQNNQGENESRPKLSREISLQRQKEIIDFEKEMMIAERINLHQLREELRKEIEQFEEDKKQFEVEKADLNQQQTHFTEDENKLFAAQIKLQKEKEQVKREREELAKEKKALELKKEELLSLKKSGKSSRIFR